MLSSDIISMDFEYRKNDYSMRKVFEEALNRLSADRKGLHKYLKDNLGEDDVDFRNEAIENAVDFLDLFIEKHEGIFEDKELKKGGRIERNCLADFMTRPVQNIKLTPEGDSLMQLCLRFREDIESLVSLSDAIRRSTIKGAGEWTNGLLDCWRRLEEGGRCPK